MPATDQSYSLPVSEEAARFLRKMEQAPAHDLAFEVGELRREIAELRDALAPVPSMILTGRAVIEEFRRLLERSMK